MSLLMLSPVYLHLLLRSTLSPVALDHSRPFMKLSVISTATIHRQPHNLLKSNTIPLTDPTLPSPTVSYFTKVVYLFLLKQLYSILSSLNIIIHRSVVTLDSSALLCIFPARSIGLGCEFQSETSSEIVPPVKPLNPLIQLPKDYLILYQFLEKSGIPFP